MRAAVLTVAILLLLGGCKQEKQAAATTPGGDAAASAAAPVPAAPPPSTVAARTVKEDNELYDFSYAYPVQAAAIPDLKAWLDADLARQKAEVVKGAQEDKKAAEGGEFPFRPHSGSTEWKVVADLPGWLSLSALVDGYTGGAHPNYAYTSLLWDKQANRRVEVADLFTSKAALAAAIQPAFCDALDAQRAKKRGEKVNRNSGDSFDECIDPTESAIILGSSNRKAFDRIGVLVSPYSAGPYAEGDYEVTLPVTPAVIRALKPQYRPAFSAGR